MLKRRTNSWGALLETGAGVASMSDTSTLASGFWLLASGPAGRERERDREEREERDGLWTDFTTIIR